MNLRNTWKAGIYIRLSKADEEDGKNESESITNQRSFITSYLHENGYELYDEYIDDGLSGTSFDRPAFNRMIRDIEDKKINMVITKDTSRLGRNNEEFIGYTERYFPEHQVRYISILDGIDTYLDNIGNEMIQIKGMMNEWYSKDISKKIKASIETKKKQGLFLGGYTPYGYKHDPKDKYKLIIDDKVCDNVKLIYDMFVKGNSLGKIANYFTEKKIPTPSVYKNMGYNRDRRTRNIWEPKTIGDMLKNPTYIGNLAQNRRRKVNYKSKKVIENPKDKWIIAENTHEPIIDLETFEMAQSIFDKTKNRTEKSHEHLLRGFLFCKECGHTLGISLSSDKKRYYMICNHYRKFGKKGFCTSHSNRYDVVEELVLKEIRKMCKKCVDKKKFEDILKNNNRKSKMLEEINLKIDKANNVINNNNDAIKTIYKDRAKGLVDLEVYKEVYNDLINETNEMKNLLTELEKNKKCLINNKLYDNYNYEKIVDEYLSMKKPNKLLLSNIIDKITIDKNRNIEIYYKIKPIFDYEIVSEKVKLN